MKITGTLEVNLQPLDSYTAGQDGVTLGRMSIDKTFSGDLAAQSKGEMLSDRTPVESSAGYVAIEQVVGKLNGKSGSFVLQHYGIINGENSTLLLEVIPNSGTDELVELTGKMVIRNEDGQHFYDFNYDLAD